MVALMVTGLSYGQTLLYQEDFETETNGTNYFTSVPEFSDTWGDFFTRTDGSNTATSYVISGSNGDFYFAAQDIDGEGATLPVNLTTLAIDVTGLTSIDPVIMLAEDEADDSNQDWDAADYLHITYSIDGGAAQNLLWVESDGDSNATPRIDTDFDGVGDGDEITSSFVEFVGDISLSGATAIIFTLEFNLNSGDEDIAIDNIRVYDTYTVPPTITVGAGLSGLDYEVGSGPSIEGSFTVEGSELTNDILITAPADFEVSETSGGTFGSSLTLTQAGGTVSSTTIYSRLKADLVANSYSGDISVTSTGASSKTVSLSGTVFNPSTNSLIISGVYDALNGSAPKGVELLVVNDIADLSLFGLGSANNGGGTDGQEFTFPADAVSAGTYLYVATEGVIFESFFGFAPTYIDGSAMAVNGDDAIELFEGGQVVDVFGDINVDGSGTDWDYLDSWAYRVNSTGPDGSTFVIGNWTFGGVGNLDGDPDNASSTTPYPLGSYVLAISQQTIEGFSLYPNPVTNGVLTITTQDNLEKSIQIFDVLGKQVFTKTTSTSTINVSNLNAGIYIIKVEEAGRLATRKLVIE